LDTTGAGATASSETDWYNAWQESEEAANLQRELKYMLHRDRARPVLHAQRRSEFATSWMYQFTTLFRRSIERNWRDVDYLFGKLMLNIINGLFIGFTYFKTDNSIQGTQNAAFVGVYLLLLILIADS